jgi:hypothetical protein
MIASVVRFQIRQVGGQYSAWTATPVKPGARAFARFGAQVQEVLSRSVR